MSDSFLLFIGTLIDIRTALWWSVTAQACQVVAILGLALVVGRKKIV